MRWNSEKTPAGSRRTGFAPFLKHIPKDIYLKTDALMNHTLNSFDLHGLSADLDIN